MTRTLLPFAAATLIPVPLILLGCGYGGAFAWLPLLSMTLLTLSMDRLVAGAATGDHAGSECPGSDALLVTIALLYLLAFQLVVLTVAGPGPLTGAERTALGLGAGLWFGQVANPCAHELIHRPGRGLFRLGVLVYGAMLFGHHASAHRLVHHRHAASREDPNTARAGEGFYRFAVRAWRGSFREGLRAERRRRRGLHPYLAYASIAAGSLALGALLAGWRGVLVWSLLAGLAQGQLLLADYVQHYGLTRTRGADGRLEPVSARHAWNAPHGYSAGLMLNAPRHSDHHTDPQRPYTALRLPDEDHAPRLPHALPVCCTLALIPPLWRRTIDPCLAAWHARVAVA